MQASRWASKSEDAQPPPSTPAPVAAPAPAPPPEVKTEAQPEPQQERLHVEAAPVVSASAQMPTDYNYSDPYIDEFAQTASTDDLFFDDDFTPVPEPVIEQAPIEVETHEEPIPNAVPPPSVGLGQSRHSHVQNIPHGPINSDRGRGGRGRGAERGRGRSGRGRGRGGNQNVPDAPRESREFRNTDIRLEEAKEVDEAKDAKQIKEAETAPTPSTETETFTPTSTDPATAKPTHSVRGDRTLTGGPKRSRLTEAQLNEKLATMASKNSALQEAHARAEADAAASEAREAAAAKQTAERKKHLAERQKMDRQNRQQMMGERERNRLRKLDAVGGREWDLEKEEGFSGTGEERRRGAARGAHGGVAAAREPAKIEDWGAGESEEPVSQSSQRERGRGRGRGRRGGRGGRGDHNSNFNPNSTPKKADQHPPSASDFPDLPTTQTKPESSKPADSEIPKKLDFPIKGKATEIKTQKLERPGVKKQDSFGLPSPATGSWADQVEGS